MLDISFGEVILVLLVAMAFLGPERIPHAARKIGEWTRMVKDAFMKVRDEVTNDEQAAEAFSQMQETMQEIAQAVDVRRVVRELSTPLMAPLPPSLPRTDPNHETVQEEVPGETATEGDAPGPEHAAPPAFTHEKGEQKRLDRIFHPVTEHQDHSAESSMTPPGQE